jgi:hypothetical protein
VLCWLAMAKRLTIGIALVFALLAATIHPQLVCAMSMTPVQKLSCGECCAKTKSCALPQKNQTPPVTGQSAALPAVALIAQVVQTPLLNTAVAPAKPGQSVAEAAPQSSSPFAILCTFLI